MPTPRSRSVSLGASACRSEPTPQARRRSATLSLGHAKTFPRLPPPSAATLGARGGTRAVDIEYRYADAGDKEGPLGVQIQNQSGQAPPGEIPATLSRDLGVVRSRKGEESEHAEAFRLIYLPAQRVGR